MTLCDHKRGFSESTLKLAQTKTHTTRDQERTNTIYTIHTHAQEAKRTIFDFETYYEQKARVDPGFTP